MKKDIYSEDVLKIVYDLQIALEDLNKDISKVLKTKGNKEAMKRIRKFTIACKNESLKLRKLSIKDEKRNKNTKSKNEKQSKKTK